MFKNSHRKNNQIRKNNQNRKNYPNKQNSPNIRDKDTRNIRILNSNPSKFAENRNRNKRRFNENFHLK